MGGSGKCILDAHIPHLHYEIRKLIDGKYVSIDPMEGGENGSPVDPQKWLGDSNKTDDQITISELNSLYKEYKTLKRIVNSVKNLGYNTVVDRYNNKAESKKQEIIEKGQKYIDQNSK